MKIICGVDVSSEYLDARIGADGAELRVGNDAEGIGALAAFCAAHGVDLVAMEATGGYERLAFVSLWSADIGCAIVNPRSVRRFAEAMGFLEKTDRIDAGVIARFAAVKKVAPCEPAAENQNRLRALSTRLRQLTALKVMQGNQRRLLDDAVVLASIDECLGLIRRQIRDLSARIAALIGDDPLWGALDAAFRQIKGVADRTVATVLAEFPEIGTLSNKAAGKLAGLAPLARDSGKSNGKRVVRAGRRSLRDILFIVAEVVRRHNPEFADFHRRLSEAGKPKKVIRVALARKLIVQLNAKARDVRQQIQIAA